MHGIQHLFRQHALEKETSIDGWPSSALSPSSEISPSSVISITMPNGNTNWDQGNTFSHDGMMGCDDNVALSPPSSDKVLNQLHLASSPQPVPMTKQHLRSPDYGGYNTSASGSKRAAFVRSPHNHVQEQSFKRNTPARKTSCERSVSPASQNVSFSINFPEKLIFKQKISSQYQYQYRRNSLDNHHPSSPPSNTGFFPHDLDDIYEYKTDHQYFTYTGPTNNSNRHNLSSDSQRAALFRNNGMQSLDEYAAYSPCRQSNFDPDRYLSRLSQFDNSSFAKSLSSSISQNSISTSNGGSGTSSNSSRDKISKSHHHHSIQEMVKHFGKKMHIWPRNRHESINETISNTAPLEIDPAEEFRVRSKSLDVPQTKKIFDDCGSTYKIYNTILKEGNDTKYLHIK